MKIKLNSHLEIDLQKLLEGKLLLEANSGGGKSWGIRKILEESHGKVQQIVIDPEGEFSTLREKFDYVLAGKDGDTPAEPRSAALLAQKLLELNVSAIIDLYELPPQERKRFVRLFVEALVNAPKALWHPVLIVIDEAHIFVPEKDESEASGPIKDLASRGRKRKFGLILATQRISKLAKDAAAECNNKIIGRTSLDIDMKRAGEELGLTTRDEFFSLRKMGPGNFLAFGPAISDEVISFKFGETQTTHPKWGSDSVAKASPPTASILRVLSKLGDLPKEAQEEARSVSEFKAQVKDLKTKLTIAEGKLSQPRPEPTKIERIEVPAIGKRSIDRIIKFETVMRKMLRDIRASQIALDQNGQKFEKDLNKLMEETKRITAPGPLVSARTNKTEIAGSVTYKEFPGRVIEGVQMTDFEIVVDGSLQPSRSQQRILNALAWLEGIGVPGANKNQLAFLADQSPKSSGYSNNLGALRSAGFISYPSAGTVGLLPAGRHRASPEKTPRDVQELHDQIKSKVSKSQWAILNVLIETYPATISKVDLAAGAGQSITSSGFSNNLGFLRSLGLIDYPSSGMVVGQKILFI